ncbi:MAG: PorT family protein, partial [Saprospiraceae bacterium]|nr:PorT family protein [Saprospiraceae bacterium]
LAYFKKISLETGVIYTQYTPNYTRFLPVNTVQYQRFYNFRQTQIPIYGKYYFTNDRLKPKIYGGVQLGIMLSSDVEIDEIRAGEITGTQTQTINFKGNFGFGAGTGITFAINERMEAFLNLEYNSTNLVSEFRLIQRDGMLINSLVLSTGCYF